MQIKCSHENCKNQITVTDAWGSVSAEIISGWFVTVSAADAVERALCPDCAALACLSCTWIGDEHSPECPVKDVKKMPIKFESSVQLSEESAKQKSMFYVVDVNSVFDEMMGREKRWNEEKRVGTVSIDNQHNAVTFHFDEITERYRYWFGLDKVQTPEGQMQWINHLRHKRWFTRDVMNDFFDCLERLGLVKTGGL